MTTSAMPRELRKEYRCEVNFQQTHVSLSSPDLNGIRDMLNRLEPKAVVKNIDDNTTLVFLGNENDPNQAIGVISILNVPTSWNVTRKSIQRAA